MATWPRAASPWQRRALAVQGLWDGRGLWTRQTAKPTTMACKSELVCARLWRAVVVTCQAPAPKISGAALGWFRRLGGDAQQGKEQRHAARSEAGSVSRTSSYWYVALDAGEYAYGRVRVLLPAHAEHAREPRQKACLRVPKPYRYTAACMRSYRDLRARMHAYAQKDAYKPMYVGAACAFTVFCLSAARRRVQPTDTGRPTSSLLVQGGHTAVRHQARWFKEKTQPSQAAPNAPATASVAAVRGLGHVADAEQRIRLKVRPLGRIRRLLAVANGEQGVGLKV